MSYRLLVRPLSGPPISDAGDELLHDWALLDAGGQLLVEGQSENQETIRQQLERNGISQIRLIGLIPGQQVTYCVANVPGKQARFIHQALPYAVEEQLGQDVDSMHLALGTKDEAGQYRVVAVDHVRMSAWHDYFTGWFCALSALYADAQLLPVSVEVPWVALVEGDWALVRGNEGFFSRVRTANLPILLERLAPPEGQPDQPLRLLACSRADDDLGFLFSVLDQVEGFHISSEPLEVSSLSVLCAGLVKSGNPMVNLCQGNYSVFREGEGGWGRWRAVAGLGLVWLMLQVGMDIGRGWYHGQEVVAMEQQGLSLYKSIYPEERKVTTLNMRRLMDSKLRMAGNSGPAADFITLLRYAGYQYSLIPERGRISFESINYSQQRSELVIELRADTFDRLNQLKTGLASMGINTKIGSVVNDEQGARARMTLGGT